MAITPADVYRQAKAPIPAREKILKVYIRAQDIQPGVFEGYADYMAGVCVQAAMIHGVTRIEMHFPNRQAVLIDCDDIKREFATAAGHWTEPDDKPGVAEMGLRAMGAVFESWRPQVTVPAALESTDVVSGDEPATKEV